MRRAWLLVMLAGCTTAPKVKEMPAQCKEALRLMDEMQSELKTGGYLRVLEEVKIDTVKEHQEIDLLVNDTTKSDYDMLQICKTHEEAQLKRQRELRELRDAGLLQTP